ncbi:MAG: hypothetical protein IPP61_12750 [Cytophagaceae bacterium]|nr:hypothetical protein [Cytophagaceae bacterium]MBK9933102.1 hypothetical protein [Cytophagaceae bacterium]MBL0303180.1 hypothetical protein [Cytophagaceae bacterium]MBL0326028.1 hypothetical protein [Cytophagaceae bacterium]
MKNIFTILLISVLSLNVFAQEPHKKKALPIEELLEKNKPNAYKTIVEKGNFLVLDNFNTGRRKRFYEGDKLRFKTKEGQIFQEDLLEITDSTFSVYQYSDLERKLYKYTFKPEEITKIYRRDKYKGLKVGLTWSSLAVLMPLAYDYIYFKKNPFQNTQGWVTIGSIQAALIVLQNHSKFFNARKLNDNHQLRILKAY